MTADSCEVRAQQLYEQHRLQDWGVELPDWDGQADEVRDIWYRLAADEMYGERVKEQKQ